MANENNNLKIQLFEGQKVRTVWSEEEQRWYFSIIDICWILTESKDYDTARKYWNKLKQRLVEEGNESVTNCHQLKLVSPKDGKRYLTDVASQQQLFRIIQSIPSKKAEPFKQWMAQRLANVAGQSDYYDSEAFYKDIDDAEQDIANGKGTIVSSIQDLDKLFA